MSFVKPIQISTVLLKARWQRWITRQKSRERPSRLREGCFTRRVTDSLIGTSQNRQKMNADITYGSITTCTVVNSTASGITDSWALWIFVYGPTDPFMSTLSCRPCFFFTLFECQRLVGGHLLTSGSSENVPFVYALLWPC